MEHGGSYSIKRLFWYHNFHWSNVWLTFSLSWRDCRIGYCADGVFDKKYEHRNIRLGINLLFFQMGITYFANPWGVNKHSLPMLRKIARERRVGKERL